jgi:hypothetical protein
VATVPTTTTMTERTLTTEPTDEKVDEFLAAYMAHPMYNPKTKLCKDGTEWCTDNSLGVLMPAGGAASVLLWPAYLGARLWIGVWVAVPWLFGYRFKVTVVEGVGRSRLVRRTTGPHAEHIRPARARAR